MIKVLTVIKKNFLILISSRLSSLILILGPIFLIIIAGAGLSNTGLRDIQAEIYIYEKSNFTDNFLENLKEKSFLISESDNLETCINNVKSSNKNLCIALKKSEFNLPEDLELNKEELENSGIGYSVELYVDFSRQRIVWGIINTVKGVIEDYSSRIRTGASDKLKVKLEGYSLELQSRQDQLKQIYAQLDSLERSTNSQSNDLKDKIQKIDYSLNSLSGNLKDLQRLYADPILNNAIANLNDIESNWDSLGISSSYDKITPRLSDAKRDIENVNNQLEKIQVKIKNIGDLNMGYLLNPIPTSYTSVSDNFSLENQDQFGFLDYIFPSFMSFFILLVSVVFSTTIIIKERKSNANIRNVLSKTNGITFLIGNFLTVLLIVFIQAFLLIMVAPFFLNFSLFSNILRLSLVLLLSISVFTSLGMLIGYLFNSDETAIIASISISLLFIIFSPLISPLESMPSLFRLIFSYTPVVLMENILRRILIFESNNLSILFDVISLAIMFLIIAIGAGLTYYLTRYKEIQ